MTSDQSMVDANPGRHSLAVINGCPRSGTTVLSTLLATRLNAALMPETHFIPLFTPYLWLWGGLKTVSQRERLIRAIYDFVEIRTTRTKGMGQDVEMMRPYTLLATVPSATDIARRCDSYAAIVEALFDDFRERHDGALAMEKTAYYAPVPWHRIAAALPSSKFLNVVRDGRNVALSWSKTWFGPKTIALCAKLWAAHIDAGLEWEKTCPRRALRVRYEDLVQDPEKVLADIATFLEVPVLETPVEQSSMKWLGVLADHEHHKNLSASIKKTGTGGWQGRMNPRDVATFEAIAGDALEAVGYQRSMPAGAALRDSAPTAALRAAQFRDLFSPVQWTKRMVRVLPAALWLSGTMGFSLPRALRRLRLTG